MTKKVFWEDPYLTRLETRITSVDDNDITVEETIFYALSGGQESDEETEKRYWEIKGFSRVPCGGTHLRKTGEIGEIALKRKNIGKGKERIEVYVSENAI